MLQRYLYHANPTVVSIIDLNSNTARRRRRKQVKMQAAKEKVSDMAASAKAGMEKTKATIEEKAEKVMTRDPIKKDMATQKKEERIHEAERQKQMAYDENAAARHGESWMGQTGSHTTTGVGGYTTGGHHPTGGTAGYATGGTTGGHHPIGGTGDYTTGAHGTIHTTGYDPQGTLGSQYPQGTTRSGEVGSQYPPGTNTGGSGRVGVQDPNVGGGARTGYGSGNTF